MLNMTVEYSTVLMSHRNMTVGLDVFMRHQM
jgi:hypothetical protein